MIRLYIHSRLPEVTSGIKNRSGREFPGSLVMRIHCFNCHGPGSIPGQGTDVPQDTQCGMVKKIKKKDYAFIGVNKNSIWPGPGKK